MSRAKESHENQNGQPKIQHTKVSSPFVPPSTLCCSQLESTCYSIENLHANICYVRLGIKTDEICTQLAGGAQTKKIQKKIAGNDSKSRAIKILLNPTYFKSFKRNTKIAI